MRTGILPFLTLLIVGAAPFPAAPKPIVLKGDIEDVWALAFSPDGKTLVSGGRGKPVELWDVGTWKLRTRLAGGIAAKSFGWTLDRKTLIVGTLDGCATFWDFGTGKQEKGRTLKLDSSYGVALTPDGKALAHGDGVWDLAGNKQRFEIPPFKGYMDLDFETTGIFALSPDGTLLATAGFDDSVRLWEVATGKARAKFWRFPKRKERNLPTSLAFSPDGRTVVWGTLTGMVKLWEVATAEERAIFKSHTQMVTALSFAPDGRTLATASDDRCAKLFDLPTGKELVVFKGADQAFNALAIHPDGKRMATGEVEKAIRIWDISPWTCCPPLGKKLPAEELTALWSNLCRDSAKAYPALGRLVAAPKQAVPFLRERLARSMPLAGRVARLLPDLDSPDVVVRERATKAIRRVGSVAAPILRDALKGRPSKEARRRIELLLTEMQVGRSLEELRELRSVEILEYIGTVEAQTVLKWIADSTASLSLKKEATVSLRRISRRLSFRER